MLYLIYVNKWHNPNIKQNYEQGFYTDPFQITNEKEMWSPNINSARHFDNLSDVNDIMHELYIRFNADCFIFIVIL